MTWTSFTSTCADCGRRFRIGKDALTDPNGGAIDPADIDYCLHCVRGPDAPEEEYDIPVTGGTE